MDIAKIKNQIESNNLDFGESKEMDEKYNKIRRDILEEWESVEDYIGHKIFGMSISRTPSNLYFCDSRSKETCRYSLVRNYYPSDLAKNTKHYVLWSLDELNHEDITNILSKDTPKFKQFYSFSPNEVDRIVKEIWYVHVFVEI